jgi:hypothetical protein
MATEITPNGKVGRVVYRRQRMKKLNTEREALEAALQTWKSNNAYNADIVDFAALKALYREERKSLRDCMQALKVLIDVQLEEMAEEEA